MYRHTFFRDTYIEYNKQAYLHCSERGGVGNDMEMIINVGGYANFFEEINKLKLIGKEDKQIAEWIRKIVLFEPINISDEEIQIFIVSAAHLLFACEVRRNPASLIIHQMILDLIIKHGYCWNDFDPCVNRYPMPMAIERSSNMGVCMIDVFLQDPSLALNYYYEGNHCPPTSGFNDFIDAHGKIMNIWLEKENIPDNDHFETVLKERINSWYANLLENKSVVTTPS